MAFRFSWAALASLFVALSACRTAPAGAMDREMASCVPPDARLLAGAHLDQVRANPALQKPFADWLSLLEPAHDASSVMVAYTGTDLLWTARGEFRTAPPGALLLTPHLALTGPASLVRTATAQHATGRTSAPALLAQADPVAGQPIWAVVTGSAPLPVSGNAANVNRLLALTDYTTLTLDANSRIGLHATGICGSAERARQLEETLRGFLSLAAATSRDRDLASVLATAQIRRDDLRVHADLTAAPELFERVLRSVGR